MRGSILRPDARYKTWRIRWESGADPATGKRRQHLKAGYRTRREAEAALRDILARLDTGTFVPGSKLTVQEYLEQWLSAIRSTVRATTWESYGILARAHVAPRIGAVPLSQLTPQDLNRLSMPSFSSQAVGTAAAASRVAASGMSTRSCTGLSVMPAGGASWPATSPTRPIPPDRPARR